METAMMNSICRCCATEGVFKCVTIAYTWMGEEEIYADMLKECFDINLNLSESGEDGGICEVCITQLRNASNFKKQVLSTEEQLKKHAENKLFKPNIVKVEVTRNDDDSDDNMSAEEAYSGPEFEVPIKTETEESKPKKRTMATRASTSGAKKSKDDDAGETSTKRHPVETVQSITIKIEKIEDSQEDDSFNETDMTKSKHTTMKTDELQKHRINIREVMLCSNATPIRKYGDLGYMCCYCDNHYLQPADLKTHTLETHDDVWQAFFMKNRLDRFVVRLDITRLVCKLCGQNIDTLEEMLEHLKVEHLRPISTEVKNRIIPFKFLSESLECCICASTFSKYKILLEHMNTHYRNYVCEVCDAGFVNSMNYTNHKHTHETGTFECEYCSQVFDTKIKLKAHERGLHSEKAPIQHRCAYCNENFSDYKKKMAHLAAMHGMKVPPVKCDACDKVFKDKQALSVHVKRDHLMDRKYKCTECQKSFFKTSDFKHHMLTHTGLRSFKCDVCSKAFGRVYTLREHMKIHDNVRQYKCDYCDHAFIQKCSWKSHMRSKHDEIV